jgi:hypothetical protein
MSSGIHVKPGKEGTRVEVGCEHQNGLIYVVPGEMSWVCTDDNRHAHSLAGFFKELSRLNDPEVTRLMRRWGVFFRERPLEPQEQETSKG